MKREERGDDLLLLANANRCKKQEDFVVIFVLFYMIYPL